MKPDHRNGRYWQIEESANAWLPYQPGWERWERQMRYRATRARIASKAFNVLTWLRVLAYLVMPVGRK
jgi:hypothetical protein